MSLCLSLSCSHFWVIAMKLADDILPDELPTNNDSFVFFMDQPSIGTPYVAAEISADRYPTIFVLGDALSTLELNDNPIYLNGPLNQSTFYTVFVWGFSPVPEEVGVVVAALVDC